MNTDYERVAAAIRYIDDHVTAQPGVEEIAAAANVSVAHCRRLFRRWAGVSPKRFLEYLTVGYARQALDASANVLDAALHAGLSGPSRLHDHFVKIEAVTPGQYCSGGEGLEICYGVHQSPFGLMFLALTGRGICGLAFCEPTGVQQEVERLSARWPEALLHHDDKAIAEVANQVTHNPHQRQLTLLVKGTNFQLRIWEALLRIPQGRVCSYGQLASLAGVPGSARATGSAVGANQVAWLIPCHRVIRSTGGWGDYRWGRERKQAMLGWEAARAG